MSICSHNDQLYRDHAESERECSKLRVSLSKAEVPSRPALPFELELPESVRVLRDRVPLSESVLQRSRRMRYPAGWLDAKRRQYRDGLIYLRWLNAADKELEVKNLAEAWVLPVGRVRSIVETSGYSGELLPIFQAKAESIRRWKQAEVMSDGFAAREEIGRQIERLEGLGSGEFVEVERVYDKEKGLKVKSHPVGAKLIELHKEKQKSHQADAMALGQYMEKPAEKREDKRELKVVLRAEANAEFLKNFERLRQAEKAGISAEFEEVKSDEDGG